MKQFYVFILITVITYSCANIGRPEGGPRDTDPPVMDTAKSTPILQTNFHPDIDKKNIELYFDEWIKVENAQKQIVVSPPLQHAPEILPKGKGVSIKFDSREKLLENTTYTINFGEAIKDLNESNEVKNLRFVFSTGPIIDTGEINGKVFSAINHETKEDFLVMLYQSDADSVVYKSKPIYFSRTDKEGNFVIANIKDTSYRIFVLNDANSNYLYDQDKEEIGYLNRRVNTGEDSTTIQIPYYQSQVRPRITSYNSDKTGIIKLQSNISLGDLKYRALNDSINISPLISNDSLLLYYTPSHLRNWGIEISNSEKILDTIKINRVRYNTLDSFKALLDYREIKTLAPNDVRAITFNHPVARYDTTLINIIDDTTKLIQSTQVSPDKASNKINISCTCLEGHTYTLLVLPSAVTSIFDQNNNDTLKIKIRGLQKEQGGTLILTLDSLDITKYYYIDLMADGKTTKSITVNQRASVELKYTDLLPSTYEIKMVQDDNRNGHWDAGNFRLKTQPEKTLIHKNISVRSNWELREQIIWKP